jgi:nucleoside-diphosphate-sugar epimerase
VRTPGLSNARIVRDWSSQAELRAAVADVEVVIHAASVVHRRGALMAEYVAFNVVGTEQLVAAAIGARVQRLVYVSSVKVYGEEPVGMVTELTASPAQLGYAVTKLDAEARVFAQTTAFSRGTAALRLAPVYGPGDKGNVRTMIANAARGTLVLPGGGRARKSIVDIALVARALVTIAERDVQGIFIAANAYTPTVRELADTITSAVGQRRAPSVPVAPFKLAAAAVDRALSALRQTPRDFASLIHKSQLSTEFSSAKLHRELGVDCNVDLGATIAAEVSWWRNLPAAQR